MKELSKGLFKNQEKRIKNTFKNSLIANAAPHIPSQNRDFIKNLPPHAAEAKGLLKCVECAGEALYSSSSTSKAESSESKSLSRWAVNFFTRCWAGSGESTMCMVLPARRGAWSTCAMVFMSAMTLLKTS